MGKSLSEKVEAIKKKMVQQTNTEFAVGNVDEYVRYFNYLRALADITAMASIIAVQVISYFRKFKQSQQYNYGNNLLEIKQDF